MKKTVAALLLFFASFALYAQMTYTIQHPSAAESFRVGVEAYGRGRYAEAVLQFEKTLALEPKDALSLYWLGKAYYKLGNNASAFARWNEALRLAGKVPFLQSRLELLDSSQRSEDSAFVFSRGMDISGKTETRNVFLRPSWIEPLSDASILVVSHGTNELVIFDTNGRIVQTINGGVSGFDRPFACVAAPDGTLYVSEFQADRVAHISRDGTILGYIGDASGLGKLSGPHYMCVDEHGFLYVSDVGFARVVKFAPDGKAVLAFGRPVDGFSGLRMPTGVAAVNDKLYVADSALKALCVFDAYGNYIETLDFAPLVRPEGLRVTRGGALLLADTTRIVLLQPENAAWQELFRAERKNARLVSAAFDGNNELLGADFDASELAWLSDSASRFTGFSVEVERVYTADFPRITFDVSVRDYQGIPVTGLNFANFYVSESVTLKERVIEGDKPINYTRVSIQAAQDMRFEGAGDKSAALDTCFLYEGSPFMERRQKEAQNAVSAVYTALGAHASARLVVAEKTAQPATGAGLKAMSTAIAAARSSSEWRFDTGLRLAASTLFGSESRRSIVYIGSGSVNEEFLTGPSLTELASLLTQNSIRLYAVIIGQGRVSHALDFIIRQSGGVVYHADRPEGLAIIERDMRQSRTGLYRISYTSSADDGFGRQYMPLNVEVYLRSRSGKDETGYFAPLR